MKKLIRLFLCCFVLTLVFAGCSTNKNTDSVINRFKNTEMKDITFSYRYESIKKKTNSYYIMSDYCQTSDDVESLKEQHEYTYLLEKAGTTAIRELQNAVSEDMVTTEQDPDEYLLMFMFKLSDGSQIYLYEDGTVKTVAEPLNKVIYQSNDTLKKAADTAKIGLDEFNEYLKNREENNG